MANSIAWDYAASSAATGWTWVNCVTPYNNWGVLPAGTYDFFIAPVSGINFLYRSDGTTLNHKVYHQDRITYPGSTPIVGASSTAASGSVDVVARVPADHLGVNLVRTAASGEGFVLEKGQLYLADDEANIGSSLAAYGSVFGIYDGPLPGVSNTLVVAADTGTALPTTVQVWGSYIERWSDLQRSV